MKNNISAIADGKEKITIIKDLSQDEVNKLNQVIANKCIEKAEKKAERKLINQEISIMDKELNEKIEERKQGFTTENYDAYYIDEQDLGERQYYNQSGKIIHTRKLKTSERQLQVTKFMNEQFN